MKNTSLKTDRDPIYLGGLFLIALSFILYLLPDYISTDHPSGFFWINYLACCIYFLVLIIHGFVKFRWNILRSKIQHTFLFLILCMISCFALNKEINIFYDSTTWLNVLLIMLSITMILAPFKSRFPKWLQVIYFFIMTIGIVICCYFALYLLPCYGIGFIGAPFLGLSLHIFIPLLMVIYLTIFWVRNFEGKKHIAFTGIAAFAFCTLFLAYFIFQWNKVNKTISYEYNKTILNEENIYPAWFRVSQHLHDDWISERVLKADLYYATPKKNVDFWDMPSRRTNDIVKVHDPLIMSACLFSNKADMTIDDRIKIVETAYGARHLVQERLWSGESLFTNNIITDVKIFPKLRIAYTEKILSIQNKNESREWNPSRQEAIYTFHLPEGAVVTSLSLWINGIEEKGVLTTKAKADTAYKTIVGVESRDPSVVHWQEGNTVTVRVFPCTPEENRRFKIGITSPLVVKQATTHAQLVYENIKFEGPFSQNATETIHLRMADQVDSIVFPFVFKKENEHNLIWEGQYQENWDIKFPLENIPDNHFSFDGNSYSISNYVKHYEPFVAENVYLDINRSWTAKEFEQVWEKIKSKNVFVFHDGIIALSEQNKNEWFEELSQLNFSIFPFQLIKENASLVISKSTSTDLFLQDLNNSRMHSELVYFLSQKKKIRLFHLGENPSPYLRTLRDFRALAYDAGTVESLSGLLSKNQFISSPENKNCVLINDATILIIRNEQSDAQPNNAPDHLARLFAYNNILRQMEGNYFKNDYQQEQLISEAQKAYVVTPVSSLIVLEKKQDYDRFDIKNEENNSLKNASMAGAGSVPEPHEWALIILACLILVYLKFKNKFTSRYAA